MARVLSLPRLWAEADSFLFSAPVACAQRMTTLGSLDDSATNELRSAFIAHLRPMATGMSERDLGHVADARWFAFRDGRCAAPLTDILFRMVQEYIEPWGGMFQLRSRGPYQTFPQPGDRLDSELGFARTVEAWRWLTLYLPQDWLVAAASAHYDLPFERPVIELCHPLLRRVLQRGVAETHVHLGAAMGFDHLWIAMMVYAHERPIFGSHNLVSLALLRCVLSWRLMHPVESFEKSFVNLSECLSRLGGSMAGNQLFSVILRGLLNSFLGQSQLPDLVSLKELYRGAFSKIATNTKTAEEVFAHDPIVVDNCERGSVSAEIGFNRRALCLIKARHERNRCLTDDRSAKQSATPEASDDCLFETLYWQYVRRRNRVFQDFVLRPGTSGLNWFRRHAKRVGEVRGPLEAHLFQIASELQQRSATVRSLEGRTTPLRTWNENRDLLRRVAEQAQQLRQAKSDHYHETGVVFHFLKSAERVQGDWPSGVSYLCRYQGWLAGVNEQSRAVDVAIKTNPELLFLLRGLDVASDELAQPFWPIAPVLRSLRDSSARVAAVLQRDTPQFRVEPLRITVHVGEDFRRLSEGLRAVTEVLQTGILQGGDRIGHGLALGTSPPRWVSRFEEVYQPLEDRLEDLLWELDAYERGRIPTHSTRFSMISGEATSLVEDMFRSCEFSLAEVREARRLRLTPGALECLGYPFQVRPLSSSRGAWSCLYEYLTNADVHCRGKKLVCVRATKEETTMLVDAQNWLCRDLSSLGVVIEMNPSSNLLIGDFFSLAEHPLFEISPVTKNKHGRHVLSVTINDDDPLTFATNVGDEYAYLYAAMLRQGVSSKKAIAWLNEARMTSLDARFTLPASKRLDVLRWVATGVREDFLTNSVERKNKRM